ncbi:TetR family transcriptional regulator [Paeniglutamicibacter sulfureus]|uniref:AcrR family transcriptional regulator n=1 Tax=Paeniglutamicibacter sulfureus TaxID=43666 RepID=A0ABU2BHW2_9MICC|nr:TetR family transcriptional regulator [Paeniglutamicibacter sulfureus]MDO2933770.1 TetR family transcriptional regulator [Paeniglutamicibacter sulfureus]MDR7358210.1 AcrR family transcriptional regulator [Paeniglutamicibacter sulfureus]
MALTREQLIDAAVGVLSEFGLADLSMRRLARELDVQVGALYWHVKSKQELLVDVAARLLDAVPRPESPTPALAPMAIAALLRQLRTALITVPDSAEVMQLAQSMRPESLDPLGWILDFLRIAGVPESDATYARHVLVNHLLGSIGAHQEALALAAGTEPSESSSDWGDEAFDYGVRVILRGMALEPIAG